jgi:hypothetical protein
MSITGSSSRDVCIALRSSSAWTSSAHSVGGPCAGESGGGYERFAEVCQGLTSRGRSHSGLLPLANLRFEVSRLLPAVSCEPDVATTPKGTAAKISPAPGPSAWSTQSATCRGSGAFRGSGHPHLGPLPDGEAGTMRPHVGGQRGSSAIASARRSHTAARAPAEWRDRRDGRRSAASGGRCGRERRRGPCTRGPRQNPARTKHSVPCRIRSRGCHR